MMFCLRLRAAAADFTEAAGADLNSDPRDGPVYTPEAHQEPISVNSSADGRTPHSPNHKRRKNNTPTVNHPAIKGEDNQSAMFLSTHDR